MEVDESIDISGFPERNVYGSVRCRGNVTKYKRAFKFIDSESVFPRLSKAFESQT